MPPRSIAQMSRKAYPFCAQLWRSLAGSRRQHIAFHERAALCRLLGSGAAGQRPASQPSPERDQLLPLVAAAVRAAPARLADALDVVLMRGSLSRNTHRGKAATLLAQLNAHQHGKVFMHGIAMLHVRSAARAELHLELDLPTARACCVVTQGAVLQAAPRPLKPPCCSAPRRHREHRRRAHATSARKKSRPLLDRHSRPPRPSCGFSATRRCRHPSCRDH